MNDATTTLRALADACEECDRIAEDDDIAFPRWASDQRAALMRALPAVEGWPDTAAALRTMADTVEALEAEADALRAEVARLRPLRALFDFAATSRHRVMVSHEPGPGWMVAVDEMLGGRWNTQGPDLDAVITAACDRLGVDHG